MQYIWNCKSAIQPLHYAHFLIHQPYDFNQYCLFKQAQMKSTSNHLNKSKLN